ncbi:rCG63362 [Rattus norvegicus]|uniref:RCG63362 n=1 Tax=Rattus norvegicus TaxID=10116 RepID=A6IP33_RAT|nr:rCG63362 [Rattus norvegicus]
MSHWRSHMTSERGEDWLQVKLGLFTHSNQTRRGHKMKWSGRLSLYDLSDTRAH